MAITVDEVRQAIEETAASWQAGDTAVSELSDDDRRARLGVLDRAAAVATARLHAIGSTATAPTAIASSWDWRQHNGVTPITDQGNCGSCVSFACVAALESLLLIKGYYETDLSEGDLHFCSSHGANCNGWDPGSAMSQLNARGVCDESCAPYNPGVCDACTDRSNRAVTTGGDQSYVATASFKNIISNDRPLVACFDVYDDFYSYTGGIYSHATGNYIGGHCVEVVGYDDSGNYWICKNSWGTGWGESGYFRIAYGQCGIDDAMWQIIDPIFVPEGIAFQANTGVLWTAGPIGARDRGLGMMPGTSPAIAAVPGGYEVAFQANTTDLWLIGADNKGDMKLGMMKGTSPSICALPGGGYEVAFQANTGDLWLIGADNKGDTKLGMMPGTSPSICALPGGGYEVAFQANTGHLWLAGPDHKGDTGLGMMPGTSPAITAVSGGYEVAFQANTSNLWTFGPDGGHDWGLGMKAGTCPSVARGA